MTGKQARHSEHVMRTVQSGQAAAQSAVAASWCRSALRHGLDPASGGRRERLDTSAVADRRQANGELLVAAAPVLDMLFASVGRTGCCVLLSDSDGVILDARARPAEASTYEGLGLVAGGQWSEAEEGTNGIGTCLAEARAVSILQGEHFASRNADISCMDAPIFDPEGRLAGALDVSSGRAEHGAENEGATASLIAALVQDAARHIERDYFCRRFARARIVYAPVQPDGATVAGGLALLAVDGDDLVIGATRAARRRYKLGAAPIDRPQPLADVLGLGEAAGFDAHERMVMRQALARTGGNVAAAARALGIGRATFYRRMERLAPDA